MMSGFCELPGESSGGGDDAGSNAPGPGSDGGLDDSLDGGSTGRTGCFQRWFDGVPGLALSQPQELTALSGIGDNRDPWISADGLRLYFDRTSGPHGGMDIFLTVRASMSAEFTVASTLDNLDTADDEGRPALASEDETLLVFSGNHNANKRFQLLVSTRIDATMPFPSPRSEDQVLVASVNTSKDDYFDPFLSKDGLRLYIAPALGGSPQQIQMATRATAAQNFGSPAPMAVINGSSGDADPALSLDETVIVFTSRRPAGAGLGASNLWYATRQSATDDFTAPQLIPTVNSNDQDGDPMLSADGCELYFASTRADGRYRLFRARVMN